ncbi:hypothetical protein KI387_021247, partial [Taxus chinensis]
KIPVSVLGQATKDKKEASLQMECATYLKLGEGKSTLAGLEIQSVGKELSYYRIIPGVVHQVPILQNDSNSISI